MSPESNTAPRIPISFEIEFKKNYCRQFSKGQLKNVSLSGAFLEQTENEFVAGDKLQLLMTVGSRSRKLNAIVVWKNNAGVGLRFSHSNNRDLQLIDDLMYFAENKRTSQKSLLGDIFNKVA